VEMIPAIIGVTTYLGQNEEGYRITAVQRAYIDSLCAAGGVPILIPSSLPQEKLMSLVDRLDGVLFSGGGDIAIDRFGGLPHPRVKDVDPERDSIEFSLLSALIKTRKPFLGICRGFQLINVGMGGTLFTDLENQMSGAIKHDYYPHYPRAYLAHGVEVLGNSRLKKIICETKVQVNSLHHQGVKDIPACLTISAFSPDGLVEAFELAGYPFGIAVQWHPEWLTDQLGMQNLFKAFIEAATQCQ
jgi:putative glutamine amidotransferase